MTPRRDCGDEPVGKFDVGTRVTPPRAVTPRVALGARLGRVRIPPSRVRAGSASFSPGGCIDYRKALVAYRHTLRGVQSTAYPYAGGATGPAPVESLTRAGVARGSGRRPPRAAWRRPTVLASRYGFSIQYGRFVTVLYGYRASMVHRRCQLALTGTRSRAPPRLPLASRAAALS